MKKLEYIFVVLAIATTLFSIYVNFESGFTAYSWQVCTLMWIGVAFIKTETIKSLERKVDQNSKSESKGPEKIQYY